MIDQADLDSEMEIVQKQIKLKPYDKI
ncbi:unnamed protein product, partial [Didymodactylos carnosus]